MKTSHTKSPWEIQELPHEYDFRIGKAYALRDKHNCCLAIVGQVDAIFDGDESKANARLIAAAPDMLEALEEIFHAVHNGKIVLENNSQLVKVHQAIAKTKNEIVFDCRLCLD